MSAPGNRPDDPREWLRRAHSSLQHARALDPQVFFEELCFDAHQAAEKALKAVMLQRGVPFPYIHDLDRLVQLLENAGHAVPEDVRLAGDLTRYAVRARYPGLSGEVGETEYQDALSLAETVVKWAEVIILRSPA